MSGTSTEGVRIVAVTQSDPFFTGRFFEFFLPAARAAGVEVVEVVVLPNFNESRSALFRRFVRFYPPADFIRLGARYVRALVDDRRGVPRSVEAVAARAAVPIRSLPTINDSGYLATLLERNVDVLLSVAAPEIFRAEALSATPLVLNVHSGRLPDYRGMMPTFWALLAGEDRVVVTVHEMAERLDAGAVVAEFDVPVEPGDSSFDLARRAKEVAGREVAALLATLGSERWPTPRPIDPSAGEYHGFPSRTDARRLHLSGRRVV
jgi:methionyl-tRNA formyltransferase